MENQSNNEVQKLLIQKIKFPDDSIIITDISNLYELADMFLSMYGMGNCKTLSEYVDMIDNEDPIVLNGLLYAAKKRVEEMYKSKSEEEKQSTIIPNSNNRTKHNYKNRSAKKIERVSDNRTLLHFLRNFGASREEIDQAREKLESGKVKTSSENFDWITPNSLLKDDFDLKGTLERIRKSREGCINIQVSLDKKIRADNPKWQKKR